MIDNIKILFILPPFRQKRIYLKYKLFLVNCQSEKRIIHYNDKVMRLSFNVDLFI